MTFFSLPTPKPKPALDPNVPAARILRSWMAREVYDLSYPPYPHATALAEAAIDHFTDSLGNTPWTDPELPYEIAGEFIKEVR